MIYLIADTHFSDRGIMRYENRPFGNVEEMDETLVENWNRVVTDEDEVYVLGDFGARGREEAFLSRLRGRKYLVKGNHDTQCNAYYRKAGFAEVYDKPMILEEFWMLSHEPLYVCENMPYANLFGHIHNSPMFKDYSRHHYCVSVERIGYTPISFAEVARKVKESVSDVVRE